MATTESNEPTPEHGQPRERAADDARRKERVPAQPNPQRPGEAPVGNGGVEEPAAFPPHS